MKDLLSTLDVANECGVEQWQVRRLYQNNLLPPPEVVANQRIIRRRHLPRIKRALVKAGYLK